MALEIEVTRDSSFCPGVDRAFRITEKILFSKGNVAFSVGPLIHNSEVVSRLAMLGLAVIDPEAADLPDLEGHRVIIRSHGIDTSTEKKLEGLGAVMVDATCPTVQHAQEAARELLESGCTVLVVGTASHPEVRSIVGRAGGPVTVIQSADEARQWASEHPGVGPVGVVCQTTIPRELLDVVLEALEPAIGEIVVKDTICESVARRQEEARELATRVDVMIVVGGKDSSNTAQLALKCASTGVPTHFIEDSSEMDPSWFEGAKKVGVTGGASTPDWLIQETVERLREFD